MTWTKWDRVNSRVYWPSATSSKSSSRGVPSMIQSNAIRVMTAAGAPSIKGLRMAGRTNGASSVGESNPKRPKWLRWKTSACSRGCQAHLTPDPGQADRLDDPPRHAQDRAGANLAISDGQPLEPRLLKSLWARRWD